MNEYRVCLEALEKIEAPKPPERPALPHCLSSPSGTHEPHWIYLSTSDVEDGNIFFTIECRYCGMSGTLLLPVPDEDLIAWDIPEKEEES